MSGRIIEVMIPCKRCGELVQVAAHLVHLGCICEQCMADEFKSKKTLTESEKRDRRWKEICPVEYQDTQLERLPRYDLSLKAMHWPNLEGLRPGNGLVLWGEPRTGKTRTVYLLMKREFYEGKSVRCLGPSEFAQQCELRDHKTAPYITMLTGLDILAFDDIDKCKMTKTQEEKFFAVIDTRLRHRRPTFFTCNCDGNDLSERFHNGKAILPRIRENCLPIHFKAQKEMML